MPATLIEAVRVLGIYTAGSYRVWNLMGPAKATCRAHVMSALLGKRVPQARAGVNAISAELCRQFEVAEGSLSATEDRIEQLCKAVAGGVPCKS